MGVLRYVYVLALVVWLGGAVTLGALAAPATFDVLQVQQPDAGRVLAGRVFGEMLRRFHLVAYAAGAALLGSLIGMALLGPRPVAFGIRIGICVSMVVLTLYSGLVVSSRIERLQRDITGSVSSLPEADPRRDQFGRLHALSAVLMTLSAAGGLALLYWEARP